jgi:hypothetical protein
MKPVKIFNVINSDIMPHVGVISNKFDLLVALCILNIHTYICILKNTAHKNGTLHLLFIN